MSCVGSREQRCHSFREEKCEPGVECLKSLQGSATVEKLGEEGDRVPLVKVAHVNDVIPGTAKVVQAGQTTCALFNLGGTFYATNNKCTHMGGPLGEGKVEGNVVTCPWHGSRFDIRTGEGRGASGTAAGGRISRENSGPIGVCRNPLTDPAGSFAGPSTFLSSQGGNNGSGCR